MTASTANQDEHWRDDKLSSPRHSACRVSREKVATEACVDAQYSLSSRHG